MKKVKKIYDASDVAGSITGSLEKYKRIWVAAPACRFFWETYTELNVWASNRNAKIVPKDNGFIITKETSF